MIPTDFRKLIVDFGHNAKPEGIYDVTVDTINGRKLDQPEPVTVEFVSPYIHQGGWLTYNILLNGQPYVMGNPALNTRVVVHNWQHNYQMDTEETEKLRGTAGALQT